MYHPSKKWKLTDPFELFYLQQINNKSKGAEKFVTNPGYVENYKVLGKPSKKKNSDILDKGQSSGGRV